MPLGVSSAPGVEWLQAGFTRMQECDVWIKENLLKIRFLPNLGKKREELLHAAALGMIQAVSV